MSFLSRSLRPAARNSARVRFNSTKPPTGPTSTTEKATEKAQETLASAQKTATQLWASAKTTLGPVAQKAEEVAGSTLQRLGPTGQKAAEMIGPARSSLMYNLSVARELAKQIYHAELTFPTGPNGAVATFRTAYETLYKRAIDLSYWRGLIQSGDIARVGVYAVEAYGIFKIGEIIGRRKVVGYPVH
ncbi:hypothetical protein HMN09_00392400 [Mycena chlorophos]|uniref:Mitochondrial F1F0-ATP synthase g subunit n=1 Tax=Mycena chlorophos TaxID=658473 RepID=A0A8H6WLA2_MYCCL|nr:hypothetical protein HMN09_00392400 [Mycena chlorophos]